MTLLKAIDSCKIWLFSACILLSGICQAQTSEKATIRGKVYDNSGEPLPYAYVIIDSLNMGGISEVDGQYIIKNVPVGTHQVQAKTMGYKPQVKTVEVKDSSAITINFTLKDDAAVLDQITFKSEAQKLEESGFAVDAIETEEAQSQSIQTNDLLDRTAGVRVKQTGGLGSRVEYNLNGMTGNSVRIFIDGIPIEYYGYSFSLSSLPTALIERVEVYKGVVPAELGNDALGGAINVVTKKNAPNTLNTSYSYGSFNSHQWSLNGNYRDSASGFTARGAGFYNFTNNNYKVWGDQVYVTDKYGKIKYVEAERFHDDYESAGGKIDLGFTGKKWADQFFVGMLYSGMNKDIQHGATMENVYGNRRVEQSTLMFNTSYIKKDFLIKGLDVNLFGSYSDLTRKIIDTVPYIYNWFGEKSDFNEDGEWDQWSSGAESGDPTLNEAVENTYVGRAHLLYRINDNNQVAVNFLLSDFERTPDDPVRPMAERELIDTRHLNKTFTGITYRNEAFNKRLKTSLFLKHYSQTVSLKDVQREFRGGITAYEYDKTSNRTGYGIAVAFTLTPVIQIMSSAESAVRLPTSQELFGNYAENIDPSYELNPEQSLNLNLGVNLGAFWIDKHSFRLSSNVFYRNTRDMIRQAVANEQAETFSFENQAEVLSQGVDAQLRYSFDNKIRATVAASVFNARFNKQFDEHGAEYIYYGDRLRNEPYFTFNANIRYGLKDIIQKDSRVSLYYNLGYVHQFYRNWESLGGQGKNIIPSQLVHDAGIAYTFPKDRFTLSFDVRNFTNEQVFDNWALQKPGRAFYTKINYKFN